MRNKVARRETPKNQKLNDPTKIDDPINFSDRYK
jgi:hypothetical protein